MKTRLILPVLALLLGACAPVTPPPIVTPPPAPTKAFITVDVTDAAGAPIPGVTCELTIDTLAPEACVITGERGLFSVPIEASLWGAQLDIHAPGHQSISERVALPEGRHLGVRRLARVPQRPHAGEVGRLLNGGNHFRTEDGAAWSWGMATSFDLARQVCLGYDIESALDSLIEPAPGQRGANGVRVLGMMHWLTRFYPQEVGDYYGCIRRLADQLGARGLRLEFVVFADADQVMPDKAERQRHWARVTDALRGAWNVVIELCNECGKNGVTDVTEFALPAGPTLFSRGSGLAEEAPQQPLWDYGTYHPSRPDDWIRRLECREFRDDENSPIRGRICVTDEPMGAGDVDQPGRRSANVDDFRQFGAACQMLTAGCTFHSEDGLFSRPLSPTQRALAAAFYQGFHFAPPAAQLWTYRRGEANGGPGINNMAIEHTDAQALRSYCKVDGGQAWCVVLRPSPEWRAVARDGWRIVDEPARGLVRLER